ncbi:MAG: histidinol-phosphate transaminase [Thermoleophilia bacterium]
MRFNPAIEKIVPYSPGTSIEHVMRRYGLESVVKLASNEMPLPPFPEVKAAIVAALDGLNRYPDGDAVDLREALATRYQRPVEEVAVGNGSCELLMLLGEALLERGDEVVFADPSFVVYGDVCRLREASAVAVPVLPDFGHDLAAMAAAVSPRTKMIIVCNPNNPTGNYLPASEIAAFVDAVPEDVLVVLDEAYNECVTAPDSQGTLRLQAGRPNVCILRTFSKVYGLAGLRIGYGLCPEPLKSALDKVRQPFNTSRLAQVAAVEALKHDERVLERRRSNADLRDYMTGELAATGRATVPTEANFMLVDINDLCPPQEQVCDALMQLGAIVRDGNKLGCPGWARVTIGTREEIDFFLERLASLGRPAAR